MKYLYILFVFAPIAILGELLHWSPVLIFLTSALAVIPAAGLMGRSTEELAAHTGPRLGGLLNATLGNAAELIITIFAIRAGLLDLVKASITGSIIGNVLLVMGLSVLLGGLEERRAALRSHAGRRECDPTPPRRGRVDDPIPLLLRPHRNERPGGESEPGHRRRYAGDLRVGLLFSFRFASPEPALGLEVEAEHHSNWSIRKSGLVLLGATVLIAVLSEVLVGAVEQTVAVLGVSEFFIGIIVVPLVGNVAEHAVAVQTAFKNKMELSMAVSLGSSLQIALFVAPLLVFISLLMGNPLTLVFNQFEIVALFVGVLIAAFVAQDGETNWLEGAQLLTVYAILALAFFFVPV